jgi:hypothetical protein
MPPCQSWLEDEGWDELLNVDVWEHCWFRDCGPCARRERSAVGFVGIGIDVGKMEMDMRL